MTTPDSRLHYQLHISDPIPFASTDTAPNDERQMFQYIATTLISGERDAVLVDPPMTTAQTIRVISWVEASGKTLKHIFITHHGDHWSGTGPLLERFPEATVLAAPGTIEAMRYHASPEVRAAVWDRSFPGQIPKASVVATTPPDNMFELESHELRIVEVGPPILTIRRFSTCRRLAWSLRVMPSTTACTSTWWRVDRVDSRCG
jgi:glyoxylase-like metal-dependent hydrolase (beta-lactamase superfamily II)